MFGRTIGFCGREMGFFSYYLQVTIYLYNFTCYDFTINSKQYYYYYYLNEKQREGTRLPKGEKHLEGERDLERSEERVERRF